MRIVHVTASMLKGADGVREVVLNLAKQQMMQGQDVIIVTLKDSDSVDDQACPVPIISLPICWSRRFGFAPRMVDKLIALAPDIIHIHGLWMYPNLAVLKWHKSTQRPFILSPHGMLSSIALSYSPLKKRIVSSLFQNEALARAKSLLATSEAEVKDLKRFGCSRPVALIRNGVDTSGYTSKGINREKTVLSLGRIHKKKGLENLIRAWEDIHESFPDWSVLIVGPNEGGERERLEQLVRSKSIPRVHIQEGVYGQKKLNMMAAASVFVLPSLNENFAITVAESLALGIPVISSHGAPWQDLEKYKCGYWVPVGVEPLAEALRNMLSHDEGILVEMGINGRNWMLSEFSWDAIASDTIKLYSWVAGILKERPDFIEE